MSNVEFDDIGVIVFSKDEIDIKMNLEYFECSKCGFHFALDATYLLQVGNIDFNCFSCDNPIHIRKATGLQGRQSS